MFAFYLIFHVVSNIIAIEDRVLSMGQVSFVVLFDIMVGCCKSHLCLKYCFNSVPG